MYVRAQESSNGRLVTGPTFFSIFTLPMALHAVLGGFYREKDIHLICGCVDVVDPAGEFIPRSDGKKKKKERMGR